MICLQCQREIEKRAAELAERTEAGRHYARQIARNEMRYESL